MVERSFKPIDEYVFTKTYSGLTIPPKWQAWQTAHFFRISSIVQNPKVPARLISYGCNNGDPNMLNCTATCSNTTLMYSSPENLWNCMTLATVAMLVGKGNDTINEESEKEMDDRFHFGTVKEFNALDVFKPIRKCAWASCSDSTYGHCTSSLRPYQCLSISPDNIADFGNVTAKWYCKAANDGLDLDIAGQGIVTAYIIQLALVLFLSPCFQLSKYWIRTYGEITSSYHSEFRAKCQQLQTKISQTRFANATSLALLNFQESQALFAVTISVTATIAFHGGNGAGLGNMLTLFSWMFNHRILQALIIVGMYPILLAQLVMHRAGERRFYTFFFVILSWILMIVITEVHAFNSDAFEKHLNQVSTVDECGGMPGPMSFCQNIVGSDGKEFGNYGVFSLTMSGRPAVHVIVSCLIIDGIKYLLTRPPKRPLGYTKHVHYSPFAIVIMDRWRFFALAFWAAVETLNIIMIFIGLWEMVGLLDMHMSDGEPSTWGFGQLVAVAIWFPVAIKFICLNFVRPEKEMRQQDETERPQSLELVNHQYDKTDNSGSSLTA